MPWDLCPGLGVRHDAWGYPVDRWQLDFRVWCSGERRGLERALGGGPRFPEARHSPRWGEQGCTHLSPPARFPQEGRRPGAFSSCLSESHLGRLGTQGSQRSVRRKGGS